MREEARAVVSRAKSPVGSNRKGVSNRVVNGRAANEEPDEDRQKQDEVNKDERRRKGLDLDERQRSRKEVFDLQDRFSARAFSQEGDKATDDAEPPDKVGEASPEQDRARQRRRILQLAEDGRACRRKPGR